MVKNFRFLPLFLSILILFASCKTQSKTPKSQSQLREIPVTVYRIQNATSISFEMLYPGKTKSLSEVKVVSRITGILKKRFFKEGAYVKKGDLLYLIEREPYLAQYEFAKAQVEKAQADLERLEKEWKRVSEAFKAKLVSESERDKIFSELQTAKAHLKEAKANLTQAELNLSYTEVRAEASGIIGKREIDEGNLVTPGTVLTTITQTNPLYVEFSIPERDFEILGLSKGNFLKLKQKKITLYLSERTPYELKGTIDFVDSKLDETSSLKLRAIVPNPKRELLPNNFVRVEISGFPKKVLLLPQKAVMQGPQGSFVYVVEDGKAKVKPIKIGLPYKEYYVVEEGVNPGELVVLDNLMKLRPDMLLKIEKIIEEAK